MAKLIGRFYFIRTDNGNLIGEFSHNTSFSNSTESADLINSSTNFIGEYNSTWQEGGIPRFANLEIKYKQGSMDRIFSLEWSRDKTIIFWGEGFLHNDVMVGDYRDFDPNLIQHIALK